MHHRPAEQLLVLQMLMALAARHCTWEHLNPETSLVVPFGEEQNDKVRMNVMWSDKCLV